MWKKFVTHNSGRRITKEQFNAIYYGLKKQGILRAFLRAWDGSPLYFANQIIDECLTWGDTEEGQEFWLGHNITFMKNFSNYLSTQYKQPSLFRDRIKD